MVVDSNRLRSALSLIQRDEYGWFSSGKYVNFSSYIDHNSRFANDKDLKEQLEKLSRCLASTTSNLWYLQTICHHANWQKKLALQGHLHEWYGDFVMLDVDAFHTKYRSTFDTITQIFKCVSRHPEDIPEKIKTVRGLQVWVREEDGSAIMGSKLTDLIQSCDWYVDMKNVRDLLIHHNARTMVFPAEKILFQVHKGFENAITIPEIMHNPYVVDFELYAGLYMGYLLWYLEEIARVGYMTFPSLTRYDSRPKNYHSGFETMKEWMERVIALPAHSGRDQVT